MSNPSRVIEMNSPIKAIDLAQLSLRNLAKDKNLRVVKLRWSRKFSTIAVKTRNFFRWQTSAPSCVSDNNKLIVSRAKEHFLSFQLFLLDNKKLSCCVKALFILRFTRWRFQVNCIQSFQSKIVQSNGLDLALKYNHMGLCFEKNFATL